MTIQEYIDKLSLEEKAALLQGKTPWTTWDVPRLLLPSMFLADGCNSYLAGEIKKHVKTPVATVGAFTDPAHMEEIIASGVADVVQLGRQSLADPDFPIKARTGREDEIDHTHLFVTLRCMQIFRGFCRLYAGGGLMPDSVEEQEWQETENKMACMRQAIRNAY